jgi:hypothetical protein
MVVTTARLTRTTGSRGRSPVSAGPAAGPVRRPQPTSPAYGVWYVPEIGAHGAAEGSCGRRAPVARGRITGWWARFADDRDLVRLKLALLAGLVILTAALERVVQR